MPLSYDWDDSDTPLAYLITIRTYGTWLHGDERLSVDMHGENFYGTPKKRHNQNLREKMRANMAGSEFLLDARQRSVVASAIRDVCRYRDFSLSALNVRTNHAHLVASAAVKPEVMINAFKANATRELRAAGLVGADNKIWSRGGSRRYLWKEQHVDAAVDYVLNGQGKPLPEF